MAYATAAVSSVMRSLDYLLHFSRMVLRVKKFQVETFTEKGRVLDRLFQEFSSLTDPRAQLIETIHSTIREVAGKVKIEDFFDATDPKKVAKLEAIIEKFALDTSCSIPRMGEIISEEEEDVLEEVPKTLQEMGLVEAELQIKCPEMLKDNFLESGVDLKDMFLAIAKLKKDITFVHKEAMKIMGLFGDLSSFMPFLKNTAKVYKNQDAVKDLEKCISVMASKAEDLIEEKLLDISLRSKLDSLIIMESRAKVLDKVGSYHEKNGAEFASDWTEFASDGAEFASDGPEIASWARIMRRMVKKILPRVLQLKLNSCMSMKSGEEDSSEDFVKFGEVLERPSSYLLSDQLSSSHDIFGEGSPPSLLDSSFKFDLDIFPSIIQTTLNEIFHNENGLLRTLSSKFQEIASLKEKVKTVYDETLDNSQSSSFSTSVSKCPSVKDDMVVGLDDISKEIVYSLIDKRSHLKIQTILGTGGIGKTTLARRVYNDPYAKLHFHCRAWITVSQVYQERDLLLGILCSITQLTDEIYKMSKDDLAEYLRKRLKGRRYLIVMDDVWSNRVWDDVKGIFPDDSNESRILLTSREISVALTVNPNISLYCMSHLGVDESWKLLEHKVFGNGSCPAELVDCGKHIAKRCQGLPLAIVVVAGYLSQMKRTYQCWKDTAATVSSVVITGPGKCLEILALSYNNLPPHLKACFLYMGAFPEDWEIDVQKLINLWIADGLLDLNFSKSLEEVGEECLNDLVGRGLVLVGKTSSSGKIKTCRIHDLLRELCLQEAQKEKFMQVIKRDSNSFPARLNNKHLVSFHSEFDANAHLLPELPLVRSFLCFSSGCFFSPDVFFGCLRFKLLRVLDISFLHFDNFPAQIQDLILLRYLELTVSHEVPQQILVLKNLRALVIHRPSNTKHRKESLILQLEYWNMPWLRYLQSVKCSLMLPDPNKRRLSYPLFPNSLRMLSTFQFGSCTREAFEGLPHLKKLVIHETEDDFKSGSSRNLCYLVYLKQLEVLKCSFYLESNKMKRHRSVSNLSFPLAIRELTLSRSFMPWEDMISISSLPNLEVLKLKNNAFQGKKWAPTEDGFVCLKHLLIDETDLEEWTASSTNFPKLQSLVLRSCNSLREIPEGLGEISTLEVIKVHYCSKSAEVSAEEIGSEIEGVKVDIRSSLPLENHLKRTLSSDSCPSLHSKMQISS